MNDYPLVYARAKDIEQRRNLGKPLFDLGRLVATPAALELLTAAKCNPARLFQRHQRGDGGELSTSDRAANSESLLNGGRLLSVYRVDEVLLYVITEPVNEAAGGRSATTILLAAEY